MKPSFLISVNVDRCRGCRTCEMACSITNFKECNPTRSRIRSIRTIEDGILYAVPAVCQQCEEPVCMSVCPFRAIYRDESTGAKLVDADKCVGCRRCVYACPFGGTTVDAQTRKSTKCILCNGDPQCVKFCPYGALEYVRSDKLDLHRKRRASIPVTEAKKKSIDAHQSAP